MTPVLTRDDLPALINRAQREHLIPYCQRMYPGYRSAAHLEEIGDGLEAVMRREIRNIAIMMPPRKGKSLTASEHFPPFFLGNCPDERIIAASYASRLAYRFSRQARRQLTDPRWPWPHIRPSLENFSAGNWDLAPPYRGGYVAAGVGGSITGMGADLLLIDDPIKNAEEADSEIMRENIWDWYTTTASTRLEPGGRTVIIMTRWHEDDLLGRVLNSSESGEWTVLRFPEIAEEADALGRQPGDYLWPERYSAAEMERIRERVGPRTWNALYMQRPVSDEGAMFPRAAWQYCRPGSEPTMREIVISVDSAFKEGVGNDYSVFAVWGDDGLGGYYLLDLLRARMEFPELIAAGHQMFAKWKQRTPCRKVALLVEDRASGQSAIQVWKRVSYTKGGQLPALPVIPYKPPGGSSQSKESRADGITHLVIGGRVYLPENTPWVASFIQEHVEFPLGAHDDQVDTTSQALGWFLFQPRRGMTTF